MSNNFKNQKGAIPILILVIILAALGAAIFGYTHFLKNKQPKDTKEVTQTRSKAPGIVTNLVLAKEIDSKTGSPINPVKDFSQKDQVIYLTMDLDKPKEGTSIEYVRYLDDQYLDYGSVDVHQDNTIANFAWHLNSGSLRLPGTYRVNIYSNGIFERAISYKVI